MMARASLPLVAGLVLLLVSNGAHARWIVLRSEVDSKASSSDEGGAQHQTPFFNPLSWLLEAMQEPQDTYSDSTHDSDSQEAMLRSIGCSRLRAALLDYQNAQRMDDLFFGPALPDNFDSQLMAAANLQQQQQLVNELDSLDAAAAASLADYDRASSMSEAASEDDDVAVTEPLLDRPDDFRYEPEYNSLVDHETAGDMLDAAYDAEYDDRLQQMLFAAEEEEEAGGSAAEQQHTGCGHASSQQSAAARRDATTGSLVAVLGGEPTATATLTVLQPDGQVDSKVFTLGGSSSAAAGQPQASSRAAGAVLAYPVELLAQMLDAMLMQVDAAVVMQQADAAAAARANAAQQSQHQPAVGPEIMAFPDYADSDATLSESLRQIDIDLDTWADLDALDDWATNPLINSHWSGNQPAAASTQTQTQQQPLVPNQRQQPPSVERSDVDGDFGRLLLLSLLCAMAAMMAGFVRNFVSLRRAMRTASRRELLVPFVIEGEDGTMEHGYLLLDESQLGAAGTAAYKHMDARLPAKLHGKGQPVVDDDKACAQADWKQQQEGKQ